MITTGVVSWVPEGHGGRMEHGHYGVGYQLAGDFDPPQARPPYGGLAVPGFDELLRGCAEQDLRAFQGEGRVSLFRRPTLRRW